MRFGIFSGILWGLDTVVLGIALLMGPFADAADASIASAFLHDAACALFLLVYMGVRHRLRDTVSALKTRSGRVVMLAALLGGPIGMTGYCMEEKQPTPEQLRRIEHIRKLKKAMEEADKTGKPLRLKIGKLKGSYENGKLNLD